MKQVCKRIARELDGYDVGRHYMPATTYDSGTFYQVLGEESDGLVDVAEWPRYHEVPRHWARLLEALPETVVERRLEYRLHFGPDGTGGWFAGYYTRCDDFAHQVYAPSLGGAITQLADQVICHT